MIQRELIWSPDAIADLQEIVDYIARDKPDAARHWAQTLAALGKQAADLPFAGRRVPEFGRDDLREVIKRGYRVMYRVSDELVEIVAVLEGHRQVPDDISDR
ncbi:MAG: type II toxin-antitoxin system RelE/ParE family toxin [Myxococcales bacterium]|nr:type II toxin-antitoxin system RelE/ParE family toxin [Myxococcales bacterium]